MWLGSLLFRMRLTSSWGPIVQWAPPENNGRAIMLWAFDDAPEELRRQSPHGGDEDFLAWVPAGANVPDWFTLGSWRSHKAVPLPDGSWLLFAAHV